MAQSPPAPDDSLPLHRKIGRSVALIDRFGIDGFLNGIGLLVLAAAEGLRALHNGRIQLALLVAMALLVATIIAVALGLPALISQARGWGGLC